jgi:hypothetical protein
MICGPIAQPSLSRVSGSNPIYPSSDAANGPSWTVLVDKTAAVPGSESTFGANPSSWGRYRGPLTDAVEGLARDQEMLEQDQEDRCRGNTRA